MLSKNYKNLFVAVSIVFGVFFSSNFSFAQDAAAPAAEAAAPNASTEKGKTLFEDNCKSCHAVHTREVGPALKDIEKRRDRKWLHEWVKNSQKVIASGDPYAKKLYAEYNSAVMTSFPSFKDEEIDAILEYIKTVPVPAPPVAPGATVTGVTQNDDSTAFYVKILMVGFVIILLLIITVLSLVLSVVKKHLSQKSDLDEADKYLVDQKIDLAAVYKSQAFKVIVGILVVAFLGKTALDGVMNIGIQQGYAPAQPIAFSHKLHAGQYKIDCNYCHTGVRKGRSANIPSTNICMNCHSQIKTNSPKLALLREAVDKKRPIEWVRVHNLPDLAYFNHSQHVAVGKIECQTCHGPIEKMEVVQQYSPLTMGWCINCHRQTDVNTEGNGYYTNLVKQHSKYSNSPMKVQNIGGLECSKCHY